MQLGLPLLLQGTLVAFASRACSIKPRRERNVKPQRWPAPFIALQLIFQYPTEPRHKAGSHVECLVNGKHRRLGALHIQQCTVTQQGGEKVGRVLKSSHLGKRCINSAPALPFLTGSSENPQLFRRNEMNRLR